MRPSFYKAGTVTIAKLDLCGTNDDGSISVLFAARFQATENARRARTESRETVEEGVRQHIQLALPKQPQVAVVRRALVQRAQTLLQVAQRPLHGPVQLGLRGLGRRRLRILRPNLLAAPDVAGRRGRHRHRRRRLRRSLDADHLADTAQPHRMYKYKLELTNTSIPPLDRRSARIPAARALLHATQPTHEHNDRHARCAVRRGCRTSAPVLATDVRSPPRSPCPASDLQTAFHSRGIRRSPNNRTIRRTNIYDDDRTQTQRRTRSRRASCKQRAVVNGSRRRHRPITFDVAVRLPLLKPARSGSATPSAQRTPTRSSSSSRKQNVRRRTSWH
jgi:hypothetical protein